jgi:uncharacterized membrane protein YphA (DoxX/SURF4 family)
MGSSPTACGGLISVSANGWEYNFLIIVVCIAVILTGPGVCALDHAIGLDALAARLLHLPG